MTEAHEPLWVIRGGVVTPEQLARGTRPLRREPEFCQISAAYQPGRSVDELAVLARFPNGHISVSTVDVLLKSGAVAIRETPGRNPVHADLIVPCASDGSVRSSLLQALAGVFIIRINPARTT